MSLLLLGARLGKFLVGSFAFVAVLAELGYPVTSIIAGLGIGGIALALAAQKTVENLFGAFSLAVDQPFREGDVIQVDGITGTVEAIGLRSTRLRSAERTLISIPNGKLCEMRIETISARDRMRFQCIVGVGHTGAEQLRDITRTMGRRLRENPSVVLETLSVRLIAVTDSAMNVEIAALLATTNAEEFLQQREALLLAIVAVIDESGAGLAHPVSHVKLSSQAATAPCHTTPAAERPAGPSSDTEG
jgi:MscS family membrane protein